MWTCSTVRNPFFAPRVAHFISPKSQGAFQGVEKRYGVSDMHPMHQRTEMVRRNKPRYTVRWQEGQDVLRAPQFVTLLRNPFGLLHEHSALF